jgi:hypothetical protein
MIFRLELVLQKSKLYETNSVIIDSFPTSCGSMKTIHEYFHHEYVFQFLMDLNDSFSHIRGQILLIDPLPSINKVFALVLQEE